ncbi:MAG: glycine cleavage system protein GcvH [Desulfobacteraceae bacterium]|nr:MAG: glycine cleavage system protein GcvH [Desulfobacteraceae bacterium]
MKEISELNLPDELHYTEDHEWATPQGDRFRIGITDFAQDQLGDIVFVELPRVGDVLKAKQQFGTVESVKTVAELYTPLSGEVLAVNETLEASPEVVNSDPYGKGWMIEVKAEKTADLQGLMTKSEYLEMIRGKK